MPVDCRNMKLPRTRCWIWLALILSRLPASSVAEDFTNAIHAFLQQRVEVGKWEVAIVVGIVDEHGSSVISCGKLGNSTGVTVNGDTVFEIGSITKTFTALLLQDMVQRGEMTLEDPVAKYLPKSVKMPTRNSKEITLLQLATHTSGLLGSSVTWTPKRADDPRADYTIERLYDFASGCKLGRDPGTKYEYSTAGMALLGQAIALKAGTNYESLVVDRICRPLQMDSTLITLTPALKGRCATGHNYCGYAVSSSYWGALSSGAALRSTANDLLKYLTANLGLARSSLTALMEQTHAVHFHAHMDTDTGLDTDVGLAWMITSELDGTKIIHHGGLTDGFVSDVCFDMARHRGVVVLCNSQDFELYKLGRLLLESEWHSERRPNETKTDSQLYEPYAGQYQRKAVMGAPSQPIISIRLEGVRLFTRTTESKSWPFDVLLPPMDVELLPESENRFFERLSGMPLTFSRDAQGKVNGLTVRYEGETRFYPKISDEPVKTFAPPGPRIAIQLDTRFLNAVDGHYEFAPDPAFPSGAEMTIRMEGDHLTGQASGQNALRGAFDIFPESETHFFLKINGAELTFIKNDQGQATTLIYHQYRGRFPDCEGKRVANPQQ
jgi:D-alanyl-D-alanine-carboxypeptidase/D-alanyl-D-alanine-endopeptidase